MRARQLKLKKQKGKVTRKSCDRPPCKDLRQNGVVSGDGLPDLQTEGFGQQLIQALSKWYNDKDGREPLQKPFTRELAHSALC
jgi:hypothetical protein